jgi:formylglycine-generating enzyme required for sulfatase activity/tRNA A-37 threonylcarbamoyl transferase component Bud32
MQVWQNNQEIKNGRFLVKKVLGAGGFGITYLVEEQQTGKPYVIKTLNHLQQNRTDFLERQERFVNEAIIIKGCRHPHIVQVYELVQEAGLWGIVMEYIEGRDLAHYADDNGQLSETEALLYIDQISQALEYFHGQGFLHRDIKPHNILLRGNNKEAVLIDFGLAREVSPNISVSMTNSTTEGYAPIEQYNQTSPAGAYSDVYALAATLYHLLTAQVPIPATFRSYADLPAPQHFNPHISDRVNQAIMKGLAQEPDHRPQTMREFRELLGLLDSPAPVVAAQPAKKASANPSVEISDWHKTLNDAHKEAFINLLVDTPPEISADLLADTSSALEIEMPPEQNSITVKTVLRSGSFWRGRNIELEMLFIPDGNFLMGAPQNEEGSLSCERPRHQVHVKSFYMSKFPITQAQYSAVMGINPSHFSGEQRPVENVSWFDAMEFCECLSQQTGQQYRLPTEAEWEYACRAGSQTPFAFGEEMHVNLANFDSTDYQVKFTANLTRRKTTAVDIFPANNFGLHDMHGNVWEWCADHFHDNYQGAPTNGSAWLNPKDMQGGMRVLRGGAWGCCVHSCRSAARQTELASGRNNKIGFRVVYS